MPRGQFYTVFTLGFATAIGLFGLLAAFACWHWPQPSAWASVAFGAPGHPVTWPAPAVLACIVAGSAVFVAYWMVRMQQAVVRWSGDRQIAQLNQEYNALVQTLGTERANEIMEERVMQRFNNGADHFDLFGRSDMLHSMRAACVLPRPKTAQT